MYRFGIDTRATEFQASIAEESSKFALGVLMVELAKTTALRLWHHKVLEVLAWADHPRGCRCPLEAISDPATRA